MDFQLLVLSFGAVLLPDALVLGAFSAIGVGHSVYGAVADSSLNMAGNGMGFLSFVVVGLLFVFDFQRRSAAVKSLMAFALACFCFAAALLKGVGYPWMPMLLCKCSVIGLLVPIRKNVYAKWKGTHQQMFYRSTGVSFMTCAGLGLIVWLGWMGSASRFWTSDTRLWLAERNEHIYEYVYSNESNSSMVLNFSLHCNEDSRNHTGFTEDEVTDITSACRKAESVWFSQWCAPFVSALVNCAAAGFCVLFSGVATLKEMPQDTKEQEKIHLRSILKIFVLVLTLSVTFMYCSLYVSGTSAKLGSAILGLAFAATTIMIGWMYFEVDHNRLKELVNEAPGSILNILKSEWIRACAVGGVNVFIPLFGLLDMARQRARRCQGSTMGEAELKDRFTPEGRQIVNEISSWDLCSIFGKVNIVAEVFIVLLLGMKLTFVFFSGLNAALSEANLAFGVVAILVTITGYLMFLLPIVPGSAVYLFAGVVLAGQAQPPYGDFGFGPAVVVACVAGTIAKAAACLSQYTIGYLSGKNLSVQQFVGVDKVPTRAMEQILKESGMELGKVCILVAGPDFPTSVLCGILNLNIPQMLLGTSPVVLVSIIPQTIVGALLMKTGADSGIWVMISTAATGLAAAFQAGATMIFTFKLMAAVEKDGKSLAVPREEHKEVAALTVKQEEYMVKYRQVTRWNTLSLQMRMLSLASVICFLISVFTISADNQMADDEHFCFLPFAITDNISAPVDLGGLGGQPHAVIMPGGWAALGVAAAGLCFGIVFGKLAKRDVLRLSHKITPEEIDVSKPPRSPPVDLSSAVGP